MAKDILDLQYQFDARDATVAELNRSGRAQAIMCCGSGKTYTQAMTAEMIVEQSGSADETIVCFVPNKTLIYQNARNYRAILGDGYEFIGVCSKSKTDLKPGEVDEEGLDAEDHPEELTVTTNSDDIRAFGGNGKKKVIFATYHSAMKIAEGYKNEDGSQRRIILANFDEAHRTAGEKNLNSQFSRGLSDDNIEIQNRAFYTATPRVTRNTRNTSLSMDDKEIYGEVAYTYPFSRAIEEERVTDYEVYVPFVRKTDVDEFMQSHSMEDDEQNRRQAISAIALRKVIEETGQTRFLSFHSTTDSSKTFSSRLGDYLSSTAIKTYHLDASTPHAERERVFAELAEGNTVASNARLLSEGVDVPGLQGMIMVDPRSSHEEITQIIGRITRRDPEDNSKIGTIIAPILVEDERGLDFDVLSKEQGYSSLLNVADALRSNDDIFQKQVRQNSIDFGRTGVRSGVAMKNVKFLDASVDGANTFLPDEMEKLTDRVNVHALRDLRDTWATKYGNLTAFVEQHGRMPKKSDDDKLAAWVAAEKTKQRNGRMPKENQELLEALPGWTAGKTRGSFSDRVEEVRGLLEAGKKLPEDNKGLGGWIIRTRKAHAAGELKSENAKLLDNLDGWRWESPNAGHEEIRMHLDAMYERSGRVPSATAEKSAERSLGVILKRAETEQAQHGDPKVATGNMATRGRGRPSDTDPFGDLFSNKDFASTRTKEITKAKAFMAYKDDEPFQKHLIRGRFHLGQDPRTGERFVEIFAEPGQMDTDGKIPYFQTGIRGKPRKFKAYVTDEEAERFEAYPKGGDNKAVLVLAKRPGSTDPFQNAVIEKWTHAVVDRDESTLKTGSPNYYINRLHDRKIAGKPPYRHADLKNRVIKPDDNITVLNGTAENIFVDEFLKLADYVRYKGTTEPGFKNKQVVSRLDETPGHTWFDPDSKNPRLAETVLHLAGRLGKDALLNPKNRKGDNGIANTLKEIDKVVGGRKDAKFKDDFARLKEAGLLPQLIAASKKASAMSAEQEDKKDQKVKGQIR